ncbi:shikimate kinase [Mycoplasma sp. P36-A1]|uniref:shikimate kinase n=1 Tax=Mycoplasma sp. P36-A1 TaxID=3252900 RepID=UPI003C2DC65C
MNKYGLIGKKLDYSYSKLIHEYLIKKYEIEATYELIETNNLSQELLEQYNGLNITMPYKEEILKYLDINSQPLKSCNTITNIDNKFYGDNTDKIGFEYLVKLLNVKKVEKVVILGSGGSSKMVQEYFKKSQVIVISRNDKQYNYETLKDIKADLLVNATPIGMNKYESPIEKQTIENFSAVIDLNYNPINSKLAIDSKSSGRKFIGGLYMLIVQAMASFEIWTGIKKDITTIEEIYQYLLIEQSDKIALIGMPLAGKSTIVHEFGGVDVDEQIVKRNQQQIPKLIASGYFRQLETNELEYLVKNNEKLIALGGGAILNYKNMQLIKDYLIIFLNVDLVTLLERYQDGIRPLLKNKEELINVYNKRLPLYMSYANLVLDQESLRSLLNENSNN